MISPFMTLEECCEYLKLKPSTIYRKSHLKEIPVRKHGSRIFFHKDEIDAWSLAQARPVKESQKPLSRFQQARQRVRG